MRRLLSMLAYQYALTMILGTFAGVAAYALFSWESAKLLFTITIAVGLLGGSALGWRRGGPPRADSGPASLAIRLAGVVVGFFVFANIGLAVGLTVGYFVGGSAVFETIVPACGTVGGLLGLVLGYTLAR